jgi:2-amino-4-hydroxy-6-hydroxymethyldihydropteridine diphosphokinase
MIECYLGLGANQQDPVRMLNQAASKIAKIKNISMGRSAKIILTEPFGIIGQPLFYNQVVQIFSTLPPLVLLLHLQKIEIELGKIPNLSWGPRKIDIDLLIYGQMYLNTPKLCLPHPQIWQRSFVTQQLLEFNSELIAFYLQKTPASQKIHHCKKSKTLPFSLQHFFNE